jgi:riboflavin biosynthesis pyrimidine reductase
MRLLFPDPGDVDPVDVYARLSRVGNRPRVRLNMIASVDGGASFKGRSGKLGGPADKAIFATLRSLADVILVGAATMRTEGYGPARLDEAARTRRQRWGLASVPLIAVITRSCRLDWSSPFFTEAEQRPIVVTVSSVAATERDRAAEVADVIAAGEDNVDLVIAVHALGELGHDNVLAEGGPGIAAELAEADLLDELCLTVSPLLVGGDARRILDGKALELPTRLGLCHVFEANGYLFLHYQRQ